MIRRPPRSTLFPSPTLSRSRDTGSGNRDVRAPDTGAAAGNDTWDSYAKGFFATYCAACHNDDNNGVASRDYRDRKSTRLNSSHANISYAVFCLKKKKTTESL